MAGGLLCEEERLTIGLEIIIKNGGRVLREGIIIKKWRAGFEGNIFIRQSQSYRHPPNLFKQTQPSIIRHHIRAYSCHARKALTRETKTEIKGKIGKIEIGTVNSGKEI